MLPLPVSSRVETGKDEEESWIVAEVGKDGGVYQRACSTGEGEETEGGGRVVEQWSDEVEHMWSEFAARRAGGREGGGPVGGKEKAETTVLDATKVVRAMTVCEEEQEEEEQRENERALEERVERAVELMKRVEEEDEGGDVSVLTA